MVNKLTKTETETELESTHGVRPHVDDDSSSMQNVLIDPVTLTFDLLTLKAYHFEYILRLLSIPSLNTLGSFVSELRSVSTTRVHGPSWRPENSGAFFDTRQLGPW